MPQISLEKQAAILAHFAISGKSKEGDDKAVPLVLKFKFEAGNDWLAHFHPRLSQAFYMIDDSEGDQLEGVPQVRSKRVFSDLITSISLSEELDGASGHISYGVKSTIPIDLAKVKGFKVQIKEGGTIGVEFSVFARFSPKDGKTLLELLEKEVEISLSMSQVEIPLDDE